MTEQYLLSWEMVKLGALWRYSNANPVEYKNTTQVVPNSEIPDKDWSPVSRITDDPNDPQYLTLKQWAGEDREFVRNVKLTKILVGDDV